MTIVYDYGISPVIYPNHGLWEPSNSSSLNTISTMDAAGEACHFIGQVIINGRPTSAKTFSSAGGKLHLMIGARTFTNGGTTARFGIQDVNLTAGSPGRGDGTFDVYKDMIGGTDTINANAYNTITMANGSKSIAHGDLIAIVVNMTARGGADSIITQGLIGTTLSHFPQSTAEAPAGTFSTSQGAPNAIIEFDDGTLGWIYGTLPASTSTSTISFDVNSATDEIGGTLKLQRPMMIDGLWFLVGFVGSGPTEFILYSDPLGTPVAVPGGTVTFDHDLKQSTSQRYLHAFFTAPIILSPNTLYGFAARPTTADDVILQYLTCASNSYLNALPGGIYSTYIGRADQTGAFSETTTRRLIGGVLMAGGEDLHSRRAQYTLGA